MHVCRVGDLLSRRDRCDCIPTEKDTKRCFWLPFDQESFRASSLMTQDEIHAMFRDRLVWNDTAEAARLCSLGLMQRIHMPSVRPSPPPPPLHIRDHSIAVPSPFGSPFGFRLCHFTTCESLLLNSMAVAYRQSEVLPFELISVQLVCVLWCV